MRGIVTQYANLLRESRCDVVPRPTFNTITSIKKKIQDKNLILTKSNKGNTVVIFKRSEYSKTLEFLTNNNAIQDNNFKFSKFNNVVRTHINRSTHVIPESKKRSLLISNPIPPRLYGLPKIHKKDAPMRPIVSFNSSPTYELAKYLDSWFKTATNFKSEYSVINSLDLVNHLQPLKPSLNSILVSFDVIGLSLIHI